VTEGGFRMRLVYGKRIKIIMLRCTYYTDLFQILYKKFLASIVVKTNNAGTLLIVVPNDYFNLFVGSLQRASLFQFKILSDICVVDFFAKTKRFELSYNFLSVRYNFRLILKTYVVAGIQSITSVFNSAIWLEREAWDMFGVFFFNHPDLRRILTDYGFDGFPLRKDFPLTGYVEVRYDDSIASIVYEPLEMSQGYRFFNFISPWERVV
jgi:NADH-quinone oxidoreductase subunit C